MRDVGVDSSLPAPDAGHSLSYWSLHSDCQKRLLDLELNLDNSVITFETLQWALAELERIEERRHFPGSDDPDEDKVDGISTNRGACQNADGDKADDWAKAQTQDSETGPVGATQRLGSCELRSSILESENITVDSTGLTAGLQYPAEMLMDGDTNDSSFSKVFVDELKRAEFQKWRKRLSLAGGIKRKTEEEASSYDGEKRARVRDFQLSRALIHAVTCAVRGEGGSQMSHRITSRLELPECVSLTNLVSHCLLISLDQIPAESVRQGLGTTPGVPSGASSSTETVSLTSEFGEWIWLHRWFVRNLLPVVTNDTFSARLDWLVAYMAATHSTVIKLVLDDLVADLSKCEVGGYQSTAAYIQRTGVLEYAALREPECTSGSLMATFSVGLPPISVDNARESMEDENKRQWPGFHTNIWLGLMVLCPTLFSAFAKLWMPTLTVDMVRAWSVLPGSEDAFVFLPAVWNILGVSASEEPKTWRAWLCAAMIKRLSELAPIASHVVLLLSALCDMSVDCGTSQGFSEVGYYLLGSLYKVLSKHVLPSVLGVERDSCGDASGGTGRQGKDSGVTMFLDNLQEHAHLVWRKALDSSSASRYSCCTGSYTEEGKKPEFFENGSDKLEKCEGTRPVTTQCKGDGGEIQRGYLNGDPLIQLCQLLFLCCPEHVVADLLASATGIKPCRAGCSTPDSLKRLLLVKKMMQIVVGQGRGSLILEVWTQRMTDYLLVASDEQALGQVLAVRQLLDLKFWQVHDIPVEKLLKTFLTIAVEEEEDSHQGLPGHLVWNMLRSEFDAKWLPILSLMHREGAWDLRLAVLGLLQQLPPMSSSRSQAVARRLKGVLGLYFSWLETFSETGDLNERVGNQHEHGKEKSGGSLGPTVRWQYARAMQHLRRIIAKLASCSYPSFTLMVNRLLDFSFEHCPQISTMPSPCSSRNTSLRMEPSATPLRRLSSTTRTSFSVSPLSTGRLDRYGKLTLVSEWVSEVERNIGATESSSMQLYEENSRIQSGGLTSLHNNERERFGSTLLSKHANGIDSHLSVTYADDIRNCLQKNEVVGLELGNLLRRTLQRAISQSGEAPSPWPCHPLSVMSSLMTERLETPHEVLMTMEQYEEILPKHISSLRHIFLAECFSQNSLLMEMLELVVKHGENREVLRCVEFVRVLLADSISRWHSTFRTRRSHSAPPPKVDEDEARSRMQVHRLIHLVASAGWLPQPLASSGEIVAVLDGADIADLLLLVWRCMHHAVAFGSRGWGGSSSNLPSLRGSTDGQGLSTVSGGNEEAGKEGTYTEWESHYFSILRQNVAQIGPHFAQVYPLSKSA